ncbi:nicotinate-nucleotide adenylyltransferase [Chungangia koreensis]|uniref:Probable nicotinate-nucleotide adenylyltransferase n=1 Tax=Chungangia koreensis TaxID=752657 RepID=A0ABV8X7Y5_9LACT
MKKVGILGGTFNPPHNGHLIIANEVFDALKLDEIRFMPNAVPPHKEKAGDAELSHRLEMTRLAIEDTPYFLLETAEISRGGKSYTYDTMVELKAEEPDVDFFFIIGGDSIDSLKTWYRIEDLIQFVNFVGVGRIGSTGETEYPVTKVDIPLIDLSSTLIRNRFVEGKTVKFLIPEKVEHYIREECLYGSN